MSKIKYSNLQIDTNNNENEDLVPNSINANSTTNQQTVEGNVNKGRLVVNILIIILLIAAIITFSVAVKSRQSSEQNNNFPQSTSSFSANNIAFGSCSSYDLREMKIWTDAIIPSEPDAWIWSGDMVYLDDNEVNCAVPNGDTTEWQQSCNCSATWLLSPPYTCHAGDAEYANQRWITALNNEQYNEFLDYMCPKARSLGIFPPLGTDNAVCDRPIYGIYDDHDFGANNGNSREPEKRVFKEMYLDAIGESATSPRRGADRGAWYKYTLNEGQVGLEVDIFLLDERYERVNIPCDTKRDYCEMVLTAADGSKHNHDVAWCEDFLRSGVDRKGSCCAKDETIFYGWCQRNGSAAHPFYRHACDVTFDHFGQKALVLNAADDLVEPDGSEAMDSYQSSPFCEVLGKAQRRWLRRAVTESKAPVKLFVSGSVLMYNPLPYVCGTFFNTSSQKIEEVQCRCGGDNMDCYSVAQRELLHIISSATGCPVVVTGDYHFSDIKALLPGVQTYSAYDVYDSEHNSQIVYQVMSSGMSASTARNVTCESYRLDPLGLRTHPECSFVRGANFGKIVLEKSRDNQRIDRLRLQVLSGVEVDRVLLETIVDTNTCTPVK